MKQNYLLLASDAKPLVSNMFCPRITDGAEINGLSGTEPSLSEIPETKHNFLRWSVE